MFISKLSKGYSFCYQVFGNVILLILFIDWEFHVDGNPKDYVHVHVNNITQFIVLESNIVFIIINMKHTHHNILHIKFYSHSVE